MAQVAGGGRPHHGPRVEVVEVASQDAARDVAVTLAAVWERPGGQQPLRPELVRALAHAGNYVALARVGQEAVGAAVAFRGVDELGPHLHSHIAGVLGGWRGLDVGFALKQHQRRWAVAAGLERVTWTFDPLIARNAYFNVTKLGARLTAYYVDFYGPLDDGINAGDETDRCLVTWLVDGTGAREAAAGRVAQVEVGALRATGVRDALRIDGQGRPQLPAGPAGDADVRLLQLPQDVVALRHVDPSAAAAWRAAVREVLVTAFADGFEVTGVSRDAVYVLERRDG